MEAARTLIVMRTPELFLPAGTLDKMRTAYAFGADTVYAVQTRYSLDAVVPSWCAALKKDHSYAVPNMFWIIIGVIGILRAGNILH